MAAAISCISRELWCLPFNKNHRFKFPEFSPVEWNASDRFPEFEVTYSATHGMLGETLLCLKMADFLNIFAAFEQDDGETISCTILDSNDDVIPDCSCLLYAEGIDSCKWVLRSNYSSVFVGGVREPFPDD